VRPREASPDDGAMSGFGVFMAGWALAALLMLLAWAVQLRTGDAGIVDFTWATGLGLLALGYALAADGDPLRRTLVAVLAGGWSFRLAAHILFDRLIGKPEDGRYQRLRARWREHTQLKFFGFFQAQALLTAVFAAPFLVVALTPERPPAPAIIAAVAIWLLAVGGETLADRQLAAGRRAPPIPPTGAAPAGSAGGAIPATPTISSSGCTGGAIPCWLGVRRHGG